MTRWACSARSSLLVIAAIAIPAAAANVCEDGKQAMVRSEYDRAVRLLETCVKENPQSADAHYWLGDAYGFQARHVSMFAAMSLAKKIKSELDTAVRLAPNHVPAHYLLMGYFLSAPAMAGGDEKKAIDEANLIRKLDPLEGHRAWASVYGHQKKPDQARNELMAGVREFPKSAKAHTQYAANLLAANDYRAALFELDSAIKLEPNYLPAYFRVGQASAMSGAILPRGEESLRRYLASAASLDPNDPPPYRAHYWLGLVLEKQNRNADARKELTESLRISPDQKDAKDALKRVE